MLLENLEIIEVTPTTMAILPQFDNRGNLHSYIITESEEYLVNLTPIKIIQHACRFFASSLEGRLEGTRVVSNMTHKAPIVIDPASGIYFFPTRSPRNKDCAWISHSHIKTVKKDENNKSIIEFNNGKRIHMNISYGSMRNQVLRTAQFRYQLDKRLTHFHKEISKSKHFH